MSDKPVTTRFDEQQLQLIEDYAGKDETRSQFIRRAVRKEIDRRQGDSRLDHVEDRVDQLEERVDQLEESSGGWFFS